MLFQMWKSHTQKQESGCKSNPLFPETTSASSSLQKIKKKQLSCSASPTKTPAQTDSRKQLSMDKKVTTGTLIEFQYVPPVVKSAFWGSLVRTLNTLQAWVSCSNKITVVLSFISSMTPTTCTFRRPRWVQVIDEEQMVFQRCDERHIAAERTAPQDCVGWMLSALSLLALQRWLRCAHPSAFLIPTAIQVSSEGWGSSLKP